MMFRHGESIGHVFAQPVSIWHNAVSTSTLAAKHSWLCLTALSSDALIQVYLQVMATLIVLLLTVSLIPIQQCASQYSASLVRVFLKDRKLRGLVADLLLLLTIVVSFCLFPANRLTTYVGGAIVLTSFGLLLAVIRRTADMLNPSEYICCPP
jgi:hypothetical protein